MITAHIDVVGSLLRPVALRKARDDWVAGRLSHAQLMRRRRRGPTPRPAARSRRGQQARAQTASCRRGVRLSARPHKRCRKGNPAQPQPVREFLVAGTFPICDVWRMVTQEGAQL
jgi:hypothetical protein